MSTRVRLRTRNQLETPIDISTKIRYIVRCDIDMTTELISISAATYEKLIYNFVERNFNEPCKKNNFEKKFFVFVLRNSVYEFRIYTFFSTS